MATPPEVFDCRRCGHCCHGSGGIVLRPRDTRRLAAHHTLDAATFLARYAEVKSGRNRLRVRDDGYCIFFDSGLPGCGVHPARPDVCRAWPFFAGNLYDAGSFVMAAEDCRGIDTAPGHEAFKRAGIAYLRGHDLITPENGEDMPGALRIGILGDEA